jgi:hypothetical protein
VAHRLASVGGVLIRVVAAMTARHVVRPRHRLRANALTAI